MKISYRADFPKISITLVIDADFDGDAVVWVMDSDKVQLLELEKFNDWDRAIDYYVAQFVLFADKEGVDLLVHMFKSLANGGRCSHALPYNLTTRSGLSAQQVPDGIYQDQKAAGTCGTLAEANTRVSCQVLFVALESGRLRRQVHLVDYAKAH